MNDIDTSNYVYLAVTAHFWGKAKTERGALTNLRNAGGGQSLEECGHVMFRAHPESYLDRDGYICTPKGHSPIKVSDETKPVARKKAET